MGCSWRDLQRPTLRLPGWIQSESMLKDADGWIQFESVLKDADGWILFESILREAGGKVLLKKAMDPALDNNYPPEVAW